MKWDDAFEARPSKNVRGEDVFDIFRKDTEEMLYSDIPPSSLEKIKKQMSDLLDYVARKELESILTGEQPPENKDNPMLVPYDRLRAYEPFAVIEDEDE